MSWEDPSDFLSGTFLLRSERREELFTARRNNKNGVNNNDTKHNQVPQSKLRAGKSRMNYIGGIVAVTYQSAIHFP